MDVGKSFNKASAADGALKGADGILLTRWWFCTSDSTQIQGRFGMGRAETSRKNNKMEGRLALELNEASEGKLREKKK